MLDAAKEARYVRCMNNRPKKTPMQASLKKALDEAGGEPLEGSGFENEAHDPEFSAHEPAAPPTRR